MKYKDYLHLSSCALILIGFFSILITGSYLIPVGIGISLTLSYAFFGEKLSKAIPIKISIWNGLAVLLFAYLFVDSFFGSLDLIGNGIIFVIFLQAVKILSQKQIGIGFKFTP